MLHIHSCHIEQERLSEPLILLPIDAFFGKVKEDIKALQSLISHRTNAIFHEPIGRNGVGFRISNNRVVERKFTYCHPPSSVSLSVYRTIETPTQVFIYIRRGYRKIRYSKWKSR